MYYSTEFENFWEGVKLFSKGYADTITHLNKAQTHYVWKKLKADPALTKDIVIEELMVANDSAFFSLGGQTVDQ